MVSRLPDWEARLSAFLAANRDRPFAWGSWDCALFATACAAEITGEDRAAAFRARGYSDAHGAALALRELGKGTLVATMDDLFDPQPVGFARRGDIVMANGALGVCIGAVGLFVGEEGTHEGLVSIPRAEWTRAWRVPFAEG